MLLMLLLFAIAIAPSPPLFSLSLCLLPPSSPHAHSPTASSPSVAGTLFRVGPKSSPSLPRQVPLPSQAPKSSISDRAPPGRAKGSPAHPANHPPTSRRVTLSVHGFDPLHRNHPLHRGQGDGFPSVSFTCFLLPFPSEFICLVASLLTYMCRVSYYRRKRKNRNLVTQPDDVFVGMEFFVYFFVLFQGILMNNTRCGVFPPFRNVLVAWTYSEVRLGV